MQHICLAESIRVVNSFYDAGDKIIFMIVTALFSSIVIATGSFAWGYFQAGFGGIWRWLIAFGVFWLFAMWMRWRWVSAAAVLLAVPFALFGLWLNFIAGWMFSGTIFALFAWDLTEFQRRMKFTPVREDIKGMERRHLARISFLALAGLLISSLLMFLRRQLTFDWGMLNLTVAVLGLLQIIAWVRR